MKKTICVILTIIILLFVFAGCGKNTETTGNGVKQNEFESISTSVAADAQTLVGSAGKDGIEITVPEGAFDGTVNISVKAADVKAESGATLLSPVYEIAEENNTHALGADVAVRIKLPEGTSINNCISLMGAYYDGAAWEYIEPDFSELADGFITFSTPHFFPFAAVSLEDKKAIEQYAKRMAAQQNTVDYEKTGYYEKITELLSETLDKMQLTDKYAQGIIIESVFKESDFGTFIVAAKNGSISDYGGKIAEIISSAITKNMWREDFASKIDSAVGSTVSGVIAGAEKIYDGEYSEAYKVFVSSASEYFPYARAVKAVVAACEAGSEIWQQYSLEYAYNNVYLNNTSIKDDGSLMSDDEWSLVFYNMGDGLSRMQQSYRKAYAAVNDMLVSDIENDTTLKNKLDAAVRESVKHQFMHRYTSKAKIDEAEKAIIKQLEAFDKFGLLTHDTLLNGFSYDMTMSERLNSLYKIRQNIIDIAGGDVSVFGQNTAIQEETLAYAITEWLHCGSANRGDFYKWMEQQGYIKRPVKPAAEYVWKQDEKAENELRDDCSGGNGSFTRTLSGDCPICSKKHAYTNTSTASGTVPPSIIQGGETVTITLHASISASQYHMAVTSINIWAKIDSSYMSGEDDDTLRVALDEADTPSDGTLIVSGKMPDGANEGDTCKISINSDAGKTVYTYKWSKP